MANRINFTKKKLESLPSPESGNRDTYYDENGERYEDDEPRRRLIETSPGRVLFNMTLPEEARFVNQLIDKGGVNRLINTIYRMVGDEKTIKMVSAISDNNVAVAQKNIF